MTAWPTPSSMKQLRGFLGLTGCYRRFVAHYAIMAAPLTELLKKDSFKWSPTTETSFIALKKAMTSALVLHLPDITKPFYIETDASDFGIGAVLLQAGHPLAYFSKKLGPRRRVTSTYHKELYAIVEAVQKWRQYLLGCEFVIRTDQRSLRELLAQVVQTPDQQFFICKLMGFKFTIEYKSGASNCLADALSRRDPDADLGVDAIATTEALPNAAEEPEQPVVLLAVFARLRPTILDDLERKNSTFPDLIRLHEAVRVGTAPNNITVAAHTVGHPVDMLKPNRTGG